MTTFTTEDRESQENWYKKQYQQLLEENKMLQDEINALRKQLISACNELMEIKR
jgi:cell division septum initiation protein DivIVA